MRNDMTLLLHNRSTLPGLLALLPSLLCVSIHELSGLYCTPLRALRVAVAIAAKKPEHGH